MYSELELNAFAIANDWLDALSKGNAMWLNTYGKGVSGEMAKNYLKDYKLVSFRNPSDKASLADITTEGLRVIKVGGLKKYLESLTESIQNKESLELEQLKLSVEELRNKYFDYKKIQSRANIAVIAAIASALAAIISILI